MTKLEKSLITLLKQNARLSITALADMTNASEKDVEKAIAKLEKDNVILQYTAVIDDEKVSKTRPKIRSLIEVRVQTEKKAGFNRIAKQIFQHKNVVDHFLISGSYDFLIIVEGTDLMDIALFVSNKLAPLENVKSTTTHFILKKYKENGVIYEEHLQKPRLAITP